jgi:hypothetical protein
VDSTTVINTITVSTTNAATYIFGGTNGGIYFSKVAQSILGDGNDYNQATVYLGTSNSPTDSIVVTLQADSAGSPSGTPLYTFATIAASSLGAAVDVAFKNTAAFYTLTNATTYWIVVERTGALDDTDKYVIGYQTTNPYADGLFRRQNGAAWITPNANYDMRANVKLQTVAGEIYKADADVASLTTGTVGLANAASTVGQLVDVKIVGVVSGLSGITIGQTYYVSATPGALATSAGGTSKKIALGISTTEVLISNIL